MEEDGRTEFKRQLTKECMKSVVAFSNTEGGTLYIGIDDDGTAVGVENPDSVSLDVVHLLADTVRPDVTVTSDVEHIVLNGKDIIKVDVQEGPTKPYYLREKGLRSEGVYIRKGPSSIQAPESLIVRMVKDCSGTFESSISTVQDLTFDTANRIFSEAGVEFGRNQMTTMGFYKGELYTNLAYLVSDQCTSGIKIAAYSDRYKTEFLDRTEITGSILSQAEEALRFLSSYNPLRSRINGLRRKDVRAYPESSLREVLVNAIVHRDYSVNSDTLVSVFEDGISVSSYGGLRRGLGIDDIMIGMSSPRNPMIATMFYRLGFIEAFGTGIPRMMGDYRDSLLKPTIELTTNVFKVELPTLEVQATDQVTVDIILEYAGEHGYFTRSDIEKITGDSRTKIGTILTAMMDEGLIERTGNGKSVRYHIRTR